MAKIVQYNGGTKTFYRCTAPTELIVGKQYVVIEVLEQGMQTNYILKGVQGYFNSSWFDKVNSSSSEHSTFIAFSHTVPEVGKSCKCAKLKFVDDKPTFYWATTSTVKEVLNIGDNIYRVTTHNNVYIIQVV